MVFEVLGPVQLIVEDRPVRIAGRLQRTLLCLLLARANRPVPVDVSVDALWDRTPDRAEQRLQVLVRRLRRVLPQPERLSFGVGGYRLEVLPGEFDATRFEELLDEAAAASNTDPNRSSELIREALALWRGTPYEGLDVAELDIESQRLEDRRVMALEDLYQAELDAGNHAAIVSDLRELVTRHPLRERSRHPAHIECGRSSPTDSSTLTFWVTGESRRWTRLRCWGASYASSAWMRLRFPPVRRSDRPA